MSLRNSSGTAIDVAGTCAEMETPIAALREMTQHRDVSLSRGCTVSIVIPAKNEERHIAACLQAIKDLASPSDLYEVIVVDSNSSDRTVNIAAAFDVHVLQLGSGATNVSASRNLGARHATGKVLAFLDADCIVSRDWLNHGMEHFRNAEACLAGYKYKIPENSSRAARAWDLIFADREKRGKTDWVPAGNMFVSRDCFEAVGGFDESLVTSEDIDLCQRLKEEGFRIVSDPGIEVTHLGTPQSYYQLYKKELWHGIGALQTLAGDLAKVRNLRPVLYSVFFGICLVGTVAGLGTAVLSGNVAAWLLTAFFAILLTAAPVLLSLPVIGRAKEHALGISISLVYFTYGLARAVCLFRFLRKKGTR